MTTFAKRSLISFLNASSFALHFPIFWLSLSNALTSCWTDVISVALSISSKKSVFFFDSRGSHYWYCVSYMAWKNRLNVHFLSLQGRQFLFPSFYFYSRPFFFQNVWRSLRPRPRHKIRAIPSISGRMICYVILIFTSLLRLLLKRSILLLMEKNKILTFIFTCRLLRSSSLLKYRLTKRRDSEPVRISRK